MSFGVAFRASSNRRLEDQEPVIDAFLAWLDGLTPKTGESIIKAINYTNGCRPYLKNYLEYLLESRPSADSSDEELEQLAPWSEATQEACAI